MLLSGKGAIPARSERVRSTLLDMGVALLNMGAALLSVQSACLRMPSTLTSRLGETWGGKDTPSEGRLLNLRRQRLGVEENRLGPMMLCRPTHEPVVAVLRQHLCRCLGLSQITGRRVLHGVGRDGEVGRRLVVGNRQPLGRMVVMRSMWLGSTRVRKIRRRVRNLSLRLIRLLRALL